MLFSNEHLWLSSAFSFLQQEYQCTIGLGIVRCCRKHCGYTVDTKDNYIGVAGMQIHYNYVTLFTKIMLDAYRPVARSSIRGVGLYAKF